MTTVLMTGANGFIGRVACAAFQSVGYDVRGAVRTGVIPDVETFAAGDIGGEVDWTAALSGAEIVVHLAGRAHILKETAQNPLAEFRRVNVEGTRRLAEAAALAGVRRFVFVSSIGVNGEISRPTGFTEADYPAPRKPYAVSKLEAEGIVTGIGQRMGMEVVIVRPPLVYGANAPGNFARLVRWVKRGVPLPLGAVNNQRSLIGVENLADFLHVCAEHPDAAGELFVTADIERVSTSALLRLLASALRSKSLLLPFPPPLFRLMAGAAGKGGMYNQLFGTLTVNTAKAQSMLGWKPSLTLEQGLMNAAQGYKGSQT